MIDFMSEVLKRKEDMLKDIKTLCLIPSTLDESTAADQQPFGKACRDALDAMLEIGKRDGYEVCDVDGYAGHIDVGEGEESFGILGHLDVVPCNDIGWDYPPYDMTMVGNKIFGRGVADDKGPLIAGYYAAKIIDELKLPVKMKTRIIFGCNEENGSSCVRYYFTKMPFPAMGFTPDADFPVVFGEKAGCHYEFSGTFEKDHIISINGGETVNIVPETCVAIIDGNYDEMKESFDAFLNEYELVGEIKKEDYIHLTIKGKSAHASLPFLGKNASTYMCHYLAGISKNQFVHFIDDCFFDDHYGHKLNIAHKGELGDLTVSLGILKYNDGQACAIVDMRVPHEVSDEFMVLNIEPKALQYGLSQRHHLGKALYVDPNSELIQKLHNAYVEFTGDHEHKPQAIGGGTYAKAMPNCVAFGVEFPGTNNKIHQNNEEIDIDDLMKATAIYAKAIYDLIKK